MAINPNMMFPDLYQETNQQLDDYRARTASLLPGQQTQAAMTQGLSGVSDANTIRDLQAQAIPKLGGARYQRAATMLGVGALGQAGQLATQLIPTSAERENLARLEELQGLERQGKLGLSQPERARYSRQLMDPQRMLLREQQRAEEARLAGAQGTRSAASLARGQRETRRALTEAGAAAGAKLTQADMQRVAEQRTEIAERVAAQGREEARRRQAIGQAIGSLARPIGQVMASRPVQELDPNVMKKLTQRYGADQALLMANMMRSMSTSDRRDFNKTLSETLEPQDK